MKQCSKCKLVLEIGSFSISRNTLRSWCKKCRVEYQINYEKTEKGKEFANALKNAKKFYGIDIERVKNKSLFEIMEFINKNNHCTDRKCFKV